MKKVILLLSACLLISLMGNSQKVDSGKIPASVKQAFAKKFPAATDVKYGMEKKDYEINFKDKGVEMSANFNATGKWLETETEIKEKDLPKEVSGSVVRNFAGFKMSEIAKSEAPGKGLIYEMDLTKDNEGYEVRFSPKGDIVMKTPLKKDKEEKEEDEKK